MAADDFEILVSCARHLCDFCGLCSNLAPILSSFSSVSTQCLVTYLVVKK
jgi:hypothetical protein